MKIATIIGARPQFIKAAVISRVIEQTDNIKEIIIHTGQHYDHNMSDVFFKEMEIKKPDYNLNINGLSHGAMTGQMLEKIEQILIKEEPDFVLVYGDTDSTLAGALAASKLHIKLAHVEAGLRSYNMNMPEEINRIITDRISNILFCPTNQAVENLKKEAYDNINCKIIKCGDVMFDAAKYYFNKAKKPQVDLPSNFVLCTIHRAENTNDLKRLNSIVAALEYISSILPIVVPIHPRTLGILKKNDYDFERSKILFVEPLGYFEMLWLISNSELIMTDSGGLQKEAYFFAKKCVTLREQTEWVELIDCKCNVLAGYETNSIISKVFEMQKSTPSFSEQLYGDGKAGSFIVNELIKFNKSN